MEVEGVIAHTPSSSAFVTCVSNLVSLTLDARLVNMVLANSAVLNINIYKVRVV